MRSLPYWVSLTVALVSSAFATFVWGEEIASSQTVLTAAVGVFSVLAGFLATVMVLIFEPSVGSRQDVDIIVVYRKTQRGRALRQRLLFYFYLATLGIALACIYLNEGSDQNVLFVLALRRTFSFLLIFSFIMSTRIPGDIFTIQQDRIAMSLSKEGYDRLQKLEAIGRS